MRKGLMVLLVLLSAPSCFAQQNICLETRAIEVTEVQGRFHLAGDPEPKAVVPIRLPVHCWTKRALEPRSWEEAVAWLDLALPLDFKRALLRGPYINVTLYGGYGISAEEDVSYAFSRAWKLEHDDSRCGGIKNTDPAVGKDASCFYRLLYKLRETYRPRDE